MPRYAKFTVAVGRRQTGKSGKTLRMIFKAVTEQRRKALIFDAMNEYESYRMKENEPPIAIKAISYSSLDRFTLSQYPEVCRVCPVTDKGDRMGTDDLQKYLAYTLKHFKNGIMLVEDVNKFVSDNAPNDIIGSLATLRQAGVDLIMHFQMVQKAANPKILGMANYIRLHKTNDEVYRFKDRFQDKTPIMMIAESIVNRRYDYGNSNNIDSEEGKFFSCVVDLDDFKIRGIFTRREAELGIQDYMNYNGGDAIKMLLNSRDRHGNYIWGAKNYAGAYAHLEKKLMQQYFVFNSSDK